jgi:hypothetical protein
MLHFAPISTCASWIPPWRRPYSSRARSHSKQHQGESGHNINLSRRTMAGRICSSGNATLPTPNSTKSFWHSEPSTVLLGHRTTPSLPTRADVVIIGSGISGASAAFHLREEYHCQNLNVVMLEAREACWGATGRVSVNPTITLPF